MRLIHSLCRTLMPALAIVLAWVPLKALQAKTVEGVVNINTATAEELTLLPGVGKAKAEQIIQYRQSKPFASVDDLKNIKGLGAKRLEALRPHIVTQGNTTAKAIAGKTAKTEPAAPSSQAQPAKP